MTTQRIDESRIAEAGESWERETRLQSRIARLETLAAKPAPAPAPAEFPVSWTVRYQSSAGLDCMLTIRGDTVAEVSEQAAAALAAIARAQAAAAPTAPGVTPAPQQTTPEPGPQPAPEPRPDWCPIHNQAMQRHQRGGEAWYSHKTAEGTWCRGK